MHGNPVSYILPSDIIKQEMRKPDIASTIARFPEHTEGNVDCLSCSIWGGNCTRTLPIIQYTDITQKTIHLDSLLDRYLIRWRVMGRGT